MPSMPFRPCTMKSRRRRNSATILSTESCGPRSAAAPAARGEAAAPAGGGGFQAADFLPLAAQPAELVGIDAEVVLFAQHQRPHHPAGEPGHGVVDGIAGVG